MVASEQQSDPGDRGPTVGLVLAGGGARGAYEAGALSVLEPELERAGARPEIVVGSSVGAINAAHVAATRQLPAAAAAERGLETWSNIGKGDVIGPIISRQAPLTLARYAGEILSLPGVRVPSLLDPGPLHENLERWIDWPGLHANVASGTVRAIAAVTTAVASGRTVALVETAAAMPSGVTHSVDYARTELGVEHLRASAAIPILFPPVRLDDGAVDGGWYVDGGTRLNTPIKPALDLGSQRLVIIATGAIGAPAPSPGEGEGEPPDFGTGALHLLHGALLDPLVEDMYRLGKINTFLAEGGAEAMGRFRSGRGQPPTVPCPTCSSPPSARTRSASSPAPSSRIATAASGGCAHPTSAS